jgi:subtilisin family serine protease
MKHTFLLFSFLISIAFSTVFAQLKMPQTTKNDLSTLLVLSKNKDQQTLTYIQDAFPVYPMQGTLHVSFVAKVNSDFQSSDTRYMLTSRVKDIVSLKVPLDRLGEITSVPGLVYLEMAAKVKPLLDKVIKDIGADSVHQGIDLPQAYTGKNVYIGVTDWGFDYTHPMFYDTAQTQTRIAAAWDQYKRSGPAPTGFNYGTEFSTPAELLAAGSDTANIYSYSYHGSHVAGIAGGGGAGTAFRGVAFEAQFLFTTFLVDIGAVLDAYQWMYNKANAAGKRLVINQSWGLHHIGTLDGTSIISQAIDNYADLGVVFVSSAGNNGDVNFHIQKTFDNDTLKTKVDFYPYSSNANMWGQSISMWGEPTKAFGSAIKVFNASGTLLAQTPFYHTDVVSDYVVDTLIIGIDTVFYNITLEESHPLNNRPHTRFRIKNKNTSFRILLQIAAEDGTVHAWNVTELTTDVGNWGMPFSTYGVGSSPGNADFGISEPACTNSTIAVAAYASAYFTTSGTAVGGGIASFSSFGPTLDGRVKPDISAPGLSVASSVSSYTDASFTSAGTITFNGRDYKFTRISGTSMSSPVVSGVVALILDANPYLSVEQVKTILKETARQDTKTGVIPAAGSLRWGAGKVDAYQAIKLALNTIDVENVGKEQFVVYPNPSSGLVNIQGSSETPIVCEVLSLDGKLLHAIKLENQQLDVRFLAAGMYHLLVKSGHGQVSVKLVIE